MTPMRQYHLCWWRILGPRLLDGSSFLPMSELCSNCGRTCGNQQSKTVTALMCTSLQHKAICEGVHRRRHKKRKQEEMQFIKGNRKHAGGYSSGGGLTSRGPVMQGTHIHMLLILKLSDVGRFNVLHSNLGCYSIT